MPLSSPVIRPDIRAMRRAFLTDTTELASFVRRAPSLEVPVPGLRWSVAEVVAHLTVVNHSITQSLSGTDLATDWYLLPGRDSLPPPEQFGRRLAAINELLLSLYLELSPDLSAEAYQESAASLLAALDALGDPSAVVDAPWLEEKVEAGVLIAYALSETLLHGQDISRGLRTSYPLRRSTGDLVAPTMLATFMPVTVRRDRTAGLHLGVDFRFRRIPARFALLIDDGTARIEPYVPRRYDVVVSIDPTTALLVAFNRASVGAELLAGRFWGWGLRAPWALQIAQFFEAP